MLERIRKQFFNIRREEWPKAAALSLFFFLVIGVFWILKPIKKGALIGFYSGNPLDLFGLTFGGAETEQIAKVLNMVVVYAVVVLFTLLVRWFQRQQVVYIFCGLISAMLVYYSYAIAQPGGFHVMSFYVFGDIFNSIMVATFWAFTNDVNRPEQSKRLYGIIGLGGVVGGFIGASFVSSYVEEGGVGRSGLLLGCIAAMAVIAWIAYFVNSRYSGDSPHTAEEETAEGKSVNAAIEGARLVFTSRYLIAILAIVGLYEIVSNIIEFQLSATVETSDMEGPAIDAFFGMYGQLIGVVSIVVQLFLTSFMMMRYGVGTALLVLPALDLLFSAGFFAVPTLTLAAALSINDNALNYSINQSAKESLYTPTSRDVKYKAKAFIDMFIQRFAKVIAVGLNLTFAAIVSIQGVRWLSIVSVVVLVIWIAAVRYAGREFKQRAPEEERQEPAAV